jgi:hypothetical protein
MYKYLRRTANGLPRIGRDGTPAENVLAMALGRPEILDDFAANLYEHTNGLTRRTARTRWTAMTEDARESWRERVMASLRADVSTEETTDA